jgi:hypothetical protein
MANKPMQIDAPSFTELSLLRSKMSNIDIAKLKGVSTSTVKRWVKKLGIAPREVKNKPPEEKAKLKPLAPDEGMGLMARCKQILGYRMGEDYRGYMLDGRPASSMQVVKAAGLEIGRSSHVVLTSDLLHH